VHPLPIQSSAAIGAEIAPTQPRTASLMPIRRIRWDCAYPRRRRLYIGPSNAPAREQLGGRFSAVRRDAHGPHRVGAAFTDASNESPMRTPCAEGWLSPTSDRGTSVTGDRTCQLAGINCVSAGGGNHVTPGLCVCPPAQPLAPRTQSRRRQRPHLIPSQMYMTTKTHTGSYCQIRQRGAVASSAVPYRWLFTVGCLVSKRLAPS